MQREMEFSGKKAGNVRGERSKIVLVLRENYKVACVTNIVSHLEVVFYELVKLVHIDIHKKLRGEIAEW